MNEENNNWKQITEDSATDQIKNGLIEQAEKFIDNVHNKKFNLIDSLKIGAGRKIIKMAFKKLGDDYFENAIVTKGLKKMYEALNKNKIVEFDKFYMKKEDNNFFIKIKNKD